MKPFFALVIAAGMSAAGLLFSGASAEAAFFPASRMITQPLVLPVQYGPYRQYDLLQKYRPGMGQDSIAAKAAFCRCYPYSGSRKRLVCRPPPEGGLLFTSLTAVTEGLMSLRV